jgi:molybdopterin/thiamine biosynthesis adenylyltransferase
MQTTVSGNTQLRMQPTVVVAPLDAGRFAIHRGTRQSDPSLIFRDAEGWRIKALSFCTGELTVIAIAEKLESSGCRAKAADVSAFFDTLVSERVLAPVNTYSPGRLTAEQQERYSRNLNGIAAFAENGETAGELQQRLLNGHVLMLGAGGLGSLTALALAMAGCGRISAVDFDTVELSNLNRQAYTVDDIGRSKVETLKTRINAANPDVVVNTDARRLNDASDVRNAIAEFGPDIVVAAIDRPVIAADRWISDACFAAGIPALFNSVSAGKGLLWSKVPGVTGCFQCDESWSSENTPDHHDVRRYRERNDLIPATSAFSYSAMTVAGMMASDITRHLLGKPMASAGKLIVIDFATLAVSHYEKPAHPMCPVCQSAHVRQS